MADHLAGWDFDGKIFLLIAKYFWIAHEWPVYFVYQRNLAGQRRADILNN